MSTHNIYFHGEIRKIFTGYPLLSRLMVHLHNHWILENISKKALIRVYELAGWSGMFPVHNL